MADSELANRHEIGLSIFVSALSPSLYSGVKQSIETVDAGNDIC